MTKRLTSLCLALVMCLSLGIPAFAAEVPNNSCDSAVAGQRELTMRIVTQEEMDNIISNIQAGTLPLNTFDDIVPVSGKRVTESDSTEYFTGTYTLRISDGDAGATYTGTVAQLCG